MSKLTHLSLFSGIGGIDLAAKWAGFETIAFCEIDPYCQKILSKHWPAVPIIGDVKDVTKERIATYTRRTYEGCKSQSEWSSSNLTRLCEQTTLISGGFPCQPHSVAGKRKGSSDERNLWPEFRRVIGEIRPKWVLAENVPGLFSSDGGRFFGSVLSDLASLGYSVGWSTYGAVDVGALHRRNRVFIVAYSQRVSQTSRHRGNMRGILQESEPIRPESGSPFCYSPIKGLPDWAGGEMGQPSPLTEFERSDGRETEWETLGSVRGVSDGFSRGVDGHTGEEWTGGRRCVPVRNRVPRLKALGNAVVPQQIYPVLKSIAEVEIG